MLYALCIIVVLLTVAGEIAYGVLGPKQITSSQMMLMHVGIGVVGALMCAGLLWLKRAKGHSQTKPPRLYGLAVLCFVVSIGCLCATAYAHLEFTRPTVAHVKKLMAMKAFYEAKLAWCTMVRMDLATPRRAMLNSDTSGCIPLRRMESTWKSSVYSQATLDAMDLLFSQSHDPDMTNDQLLKEASYTFEAHGLVDWLPKSRAYHSDWIDQTNAFCDDITCRAEHNRMLALMPGTKAQRISNHLAMPEGVSNPQSLQTRLQMMDRWLKQLDRAATLVTNESSDAPLYARIHATHSAARVLQRVLTRPFDVTKVSNTHLNTLLQRAKIEQRMFDMIGEREVRVAYHDHQPIALLHLRAHKLRGVVLTNPAFRPTLETMFGPSKQDIWGDVNAEDHASVIQHFNTFNQRLLDYEEHMQQKFKMFKRHKDQRRIAPSLIRYDYSTQSKQALIHARNKASALDVNVAMIDQKYFSKRSALPPDVSDWPIVNFPANGMIPHSTYFPLGTTPHTSQTSQSAVSPATTATTPSKSSSSPYSTSSSFRRSSTSRSSGRFSGGGGGFRSGKN